LADGDTEARVLPVGATLYNKESLLDCSMSTAIDGDWGQSSDGGGREDGEDGKKAEVCPEIDC
jgi:hypothetical protein